MSECTHDCSSCGADCSSRDLKAPANAKSKVKKVIAVVSGKGGVGKSTGTASLAAAMAKRGRKVAVLDADITGPSIPTAFGIHERAMATEDGIQPAVTPGGIKLMSLNLLTENETDPVIWRGPVIAGVVTQFWTDVVWGDVDYMFGDMPPGTGDVPLTVFQSLPVDGIIVVTSPQDLVSMIVTKAVHMAQMMSIPVLGLIENYSYYQCPDCGAKHAIFGESHLEQEAMQLGLPLLAQLPIDPELAAAIDVGKAESLPVNYLDDPVPLRQHTCTSHHIFQLTDIAGPRIGHESLPDVPVKSPYFLFQFLIRGREEESGQRHDVLPAVLQRRNMERELVQPVEKVLPEPSLAYRLFQVLVGGRQQPDIRMHLLRSTDKSVALLLQGAQQLYLRLHIQVADLIQKQCPVLGGSEHAALVLHRSGKSPLLMPEQFRCGQFPWKGSAVHCYERGGRTLAESVYLPCHPLLARTRRPAYHKAI